MQPLPYFFSIMQIYETSIKICWTLQLVNMILLHLQQLLVNIMMLNPNFPPEDNVDCGSEVSVPSPDFLKAMSTWKQDV